MFCLQIRFRLFAFTEAGALRSIFLRYCFVFVFMLSLKPRPFVQSSFEMHAPRYFFFLLFIWRCRTITVFSLYHYRFLFVPLPFSLCNITVFSLYHYRFLCTITVFSLYHYRFSLNREYVVRFSLSGGVFLPCDHGWIFFASACVRNHSIQSFHSFNHSTG